MIDTSKFNILFTEAVTAAKTTLASIQNSPVIIAAQPAIGVVGSLLGVVSGYEIGHTSILKARGLWHPSLVRPVVLLIGALALTIIACPQAAITISVCTIGAAIFGAIKAGFEKGAAGNMDFEKYQQVYGNKPVDVKLITPTQFNLLENPTKKDVCGLMWNLTKEACDRGESFTEGTFVLEGDQARDIYHKLSKIDGAYDRHSSHFKGRVQENSPQNGLDFGSDSDVLPANKRTILFGLADTHDGNLVLFIKPENWGADHRISSLRNFEKLKHFANHTLQFIHAQYVKVMRPGYDDRPGTAKERIPHKWKAANTKFGWAGLSETEKRTLIDNGSIPKAWLTDTYRTGQEVYIKMQQHLEL